ncbi:MAG: SRPBCC domain-containing protein [Crocinitomicaceae bacterium]|nr:SRPBCC domain-containing protein [Crocinitomicaceae bacterium]
MNKIVVTATIHAPIEKVWDCYTNPTHIVNWNFADPSWHCPRAENDMKIGGTYKARMEAKDGSFGFDFEAVYTEINEGKSFTFEFGGRICTYEFNDLGADTLVSITFDPETENSIELQKNGWQLILNNFKLYSENKAK